MTHVLRDTFHEALSKLVTVAVKMPFVRTRKRVKKKLMYAKFHKKWTEIQWQCYGGMNLSLNVLVKIVKTFA